MPSARRSPETRPTRRPPGRRSGRSTGRSSDGCSTGASRWSTRRASSAAARRSLVQRAAVARVPAIAIVLDPPPATVHARNAARVGRSVPADAVDRQLADLAASLLPGGLDHEGFLAITGSPIPPRSRRSRCVGSLVPDREKARKRRVAAAVRPPRHAVWQCDANCLETGRRMLRIAAIGPGNLEFASRSGRRMRSPSQCHSQWPTAPTADSGRAGSDGAWRPRRSAGLAPRRRASCKRADLTTRIPLWSILTTSVEITRKHDIRHRNYGGPMRTVTRGRTLATLALAATIVAACSSGSGATSAPSQAASAPAASAPAASAPDGSAAAGGLSPPSRTRPPSGSGSSRTSPTRPGLVALADGGPLQQLLPNADITVTPFNSGTPAVEALLDGLPSTSPTSAPTRRSTRSRSPTARRSASSPARPRAARSSSSSPRSPAPPTSRARRSRRPSLGNTQDVALRAG